LIEALGEQEAHAEARHDLPEALREGSSKLFRSAFLRRAHRIEDNGTAG